MLSLRLQRNNDKFDLQKKISEPAGSIRQKVRSQLMVLRIPDQSDYTDQSNHSNQSETSLTILTSLTRPAAVGWLFLHD